MPELRIQKPSPRQMLFLQSTARYTAFGGARGGGKSWAVRVKAVLLCLKYPGIKVSIIRRTFPELDSNHIRPLVSMLFCYADKGMKLASYNEQKKRITFPGGSTIKFAYCASEKDLGQFQGQEFDVMFIDEATQISETQFVQLTACVRGANSFPKRIYLTCNPGGVGHGWVKRLFIERNYRKGERAEDYVFIKSLVTDNMALMKKDPEYIRHLEALPPKLRQAWLEGDWDIFEGQFFEDFRINPTETECEAAGITVEEAKATGRFCHVIEPFDLSRMNVQIYRSYDFGYNKPFSCGWWAVTPDNIVIRILELYGCRENEANVGLKWDVDRQFEEIARVEREHPWLSGRQIFGIADPSIWDKSRGPSILEKAERHGIYFEPGNNNRIAGWMQCHNRLAFDENGRPMMYVFSNCKAFIRTVPLLCYSETIPEDLDTDGEDHVADEWRYFLMSRPIPPRKKEPPARFRPEVDPLNTMTDNF